MKNKKLQKNMDLTTYLKILKFLKKNNQDTVRLLGWEPLLYPNIRKIIQIASKWWFSITIFSNIIIENIKIKKIFNWLKWIRINCNINEKDFYKKSDIINISKNLKTINNLWFKSSLWYNIIQLNSEPNFIFELAKKFNIQHINIKITNSSLWWKLLIDNSSRDLWIYIFNIIKKYHNILNLYFSCGVNKSIFLPEELYYIKNNTNIELYFWCNGNIWKFDINTDWSIFKCYPLKNIFETKKYKHINIENLLKNNIWIKEVNEEINKWLFSEWECTANKKIKKYL